MVMMEFGNKTVDFAGPKVMGIINMTPDSFSDGGKINSIDKGLQEAEQMINAGATFIDIGGESTRPGAVEVSVEDELARVIPIIRAITSELDTIVSIDTSKPKVMLQAVNAGARLINDVRALTKPGALEIAASLAVKENIPTCIMHMQGTPQNMQDAPEYASVVESILGFFSEKIKTLTNAGFSYNQIMLDPGFGFGKTLEHNYQILKHFSSFTQFDMPVLAGMSRKSMIGNVLDKPVGERLFGDVAAHTIAALQGAAVLRVHDAGAVIDAVKIVEKINSVE